MPTKTKKTAVEKRAKKNSGRGRVRLFLLSDSDSFWLVAVLPDLTPKVINFWYKEKLLAVDAAESCIDLVRFTGVPVSNHVVEVEVSDFFKSLAGVDGTVMTYKGHVFDCEADLIHFALEDRKFVSAMVRGRALPVS